MSTTVKTWDKFEKRCSCQEPTWVVGRICCDSEGRLNDKSVMLEGSLEHSQVNT